MTYSVVFSNKARTDIAGLDVNLAAKIVAKIEQLASAPHEMPGVKKLKGKLKGVSRIRVADYRILYQQKDALLLILIITIGNRKDIYK
jgi:mRNA interferase RelE/StbE